MRTLTALTNLIQAVLDRTDQILRIAILAIVLWPLIVISLGFLPWPNVTVFLATGVPIVAIVFLLARYPTIALIASRTPATEEAIRWLFTIAGIEVLIGLFFSWIPIENDPRLVPTLVAVATGAVLLALGTSGKWARRAIGALIVAGLIITAIFLMGGREEANTTLTNAPTTIAEKARVLFGDYPTCVATHAGVQAVLDGTVSIVLHENCVTGMIYMPVRTPKFNIQYRVEDVGGWAEFNGRETGRILADIGEYKELGHVRSGFTARGKGTLEVTLVKEGS